MTKLRTLAAVAATAYALTFGTAFANETIKLGVSFYPFYSADSTKPDLLDAISPALAERGYEIEKVAFLNYAEANPARASGDDSGSFLHVRN